MGEKYKTGTFQTMSDVRVEKNPTDPETPNNNENPEEPKKKKFNKTIIYMAIILAVTAVALYFSLKDSFNDIVSVMGQSRIDFILYAVLAYFGSFFFEGLVLYLFARRYKRKYYLHQGLANQGIAVFYNAVTPGQTGGQFMQAYTFKKQGLSLPNATSCLVMNFIVYQSTLVLYSLFAILFKFTNLMSIDPIKIEVNGTVIFALPIWVLTIIAFVLNLGIIGLIFLMSYSKHFHNFILNKGINFLARIHLVKKPDERRRKLAVSVESFKLELNNLFTKPVFLILVFILHVASLTCLFMVPYFVGHAVIGPAEQFGHYSYSMIDTIAYSGFQKLVAELIPIPGSAGTAEYFFYQLFQGAFTDAVPSAHALASSLNIIWRTITFHIPLIVTGILAAFYRGKDRDALPYDTVGNARTEFRELQSKTMIERRETYESDFATRVIERESRKAKRSNSKNKKDKEK